MPEPFSLYFFLTTFPKASLGCSLSLRLSLSENSVPPIARGAFSYKGKGIILVEDNDSPEYSSQEMWGLQTNH